MRQYYLRAGGDVGDLQVNLVDKHLRAASRATPSPRGCGRRCRRSAQRFGANVKVVEVPPGPPVLSPIVAEIYGPEAEGRAAGRARQCARCSSSTAGVVDVDDSSIAAAPQDAAAGRPRARRRCSGVPQQAIVTTLRAGLAGEATAYLHDESKYPAAAALQLPAERQGDLDALLQLARARRRGPAGADPRARDAERHACASSRSTTRTCCR